MLSITYFGWNKRVGYPIYTVYTIYILGTSSIKLMTMITHNADYHELNRIGGIAKRLRIHKMINLKWCGMMLLLVLRTQMMESTHTHTRIYFQTYTNTVSIPNPFEWQPKRIEITFIKINYYKLIIKANFFAH